MSAQPSEVPAISGAVARTVIQGKIVGLRKAGQSFLHLVAMPAPDPYSHPVTVEVSSDRRLGARDDEIKVEADHAKTEDRREFWKSVNFGLKRTAAVFVLSAMLGFFGYGLQGGGKAQADELRPGPTSHNGALRSRLARIGRKVEAWTKAKFGCCWRWCGYCGT